jgi:hypothetical protein
MEKNNFVVCFVLMIVVCLFPGPILAELPSWVQNPGQHYPSGKYLVGVGSGYSMIEAKNKAKTEISSIFSQKIESTQSLTHQAEETFNSSGGGGLKEKINSINQMQVTTGGELQGIQIKETKYNPQNGKYYALAVIDRYEAAQSYEQLFQQNLQELQSNYSQAGQSQDKLQKLKYLARAQNNAKNALKLKNQLAVLAPAKSRSKTVTPEPSTINRELDKVLQDLTVYVRKPVLNNICPGSGFEKQVQSWIEKAFNQLSFRTTKIAAKAEFAVASNLSANYTTKGGRDAIGIRWDITIQLKKPGPGPTFATVNFMDVGVGTDKSMAATRTRQYIGEWIKQKLPDLIVRKLLS